MPSSEMTVAKIKLLVRELGLNTMSQKGAGKKGKTRGNHSSKSKKGKGGLSPQNGPYDDDFVGDGRDNWTDEDWIKYEEGNFDDDDVVDVDDDDDVDDKYTSSENRKNKNNNKVDHDDDYGDDYDDYDEYDEYEDDYGEPRY
jgi:hypothetical protein